jgi:glycosyltransferase 2 family protein
MTNFQKQQVEDTQETVRKSFRLSRTILPVLIGIGVVFYLVWKDFNIQEFHKIEWTSHTLIWLLIALAILAFRHFSYMARLHILTEGEFSWRKCFDLIFIWEFSSAVTPTSVGGSAVALFVLSQEKLSTAKTATIVIYTVILDSLFFLIGVPTFYLIFGNEIIPPDEAQFFGNLGATLILILTFSGMFLYTMLFIWGVFINPKRIKTVLLFFCKIPFLKRFQTKAEQLGDDIILTSKEVKAKNWQYHVKAFLATCGAWTGKFLLIVAIIIALVPSFETNIPLLILTFAKLQTMFVLILLFPSPGGAGFAELAFKAFMYGYIPSTSALVIALVWRLMSYYSYLIGGAIIIPAWLQNRWKERQGS